MKPIVGEKRRDGIHFQLPNDISLVQVGETTTNLRVYFGDEQAGILSNAAVQRLFEVILYPPGSVPSPEVAPPSINLYAKDLQAQGLAEEYEIPRQDLEQR